MKLNKIGDLGSRSLAVIMVAVLIAVIIRVFFYADPTVAGTYQGLLSEVAWPILMFAMGAYGINKAADTYERTETTRIHVTAANPRLPGDDDVLGAG